MNSNRKFQTPKHDNRGCFSIQGSSSKVNPNMFEISVDVGTSPKFYENRKCSTNSANEKIMNFSVASKSNQKESITIEINLNNLYESANVENSTSNPNKSSAISNDIRGIKSEIKKKLSITNFKSQEDQIHMKNI